MDSQSLAEFLLLASRVEELGTSLALQHSLSLRLDTSPACLNNANAKSFTS